MKTGHLLFLLVVIVLIFVQKQLTGQLGIYLGMGLKSSPPSIITAAPVCLFLQYLWKVKYREHYSSDLIRLILVAKTPSEFY